NDLGAIPTFYNSEEILPSSLSGRGLATMRDIVGALMDAAVILQNDPSRGWHISFWIPCSPPG
ncbi:putative CDC42 small effector protein, partial [Naja naja]